MLRRRKTASGARRSTRVSRPAVTRSRSDSPPALTRHATSGRPGPTRSGWSSRRWRGSTGGRPTSAVVFFSLPTWRPDGAIAPARAGGPGTACGTCSARRRYSRGSWRPLTCPGWPGTPMSGSRSTCTSGRPPAFLTGRAQLPNDPGLGPAGTADTRHSPSRVIDREHGCQAALPCARDVIASMEVAKALPQPREIGRSPALLVTNSGGQGQGNARGTPI
jgi:hypothetical protein